MEIRRAKTEDAAAISRLICRLTEQHITPGCSAEGGQHLLGTMTPAAVEQRLASGDRHHVAIHHGTLVGVIVTRADKHLYHLFVADAFQRRGLAKRLWAVASQACLESGGSGQFSVNSARSAVGFYRKLGFAEAGPPAEERGVVSVPMIWLPSVADSAEPAQVAPIARIATSVPRHNFEVRR